MSVTLGEWYEYWLDTYMKNTVKQSTLRQLPQLLEQAFLCAGENPAEKVRATHLAGVLQLQIPRRRAVAQDASQLPHGIA